MGEASADGSGQDPSDNKSDKKPGRKRLLLAAPIIVLAAGAFYATYAGLVSLPLGDKARPSHPPTDLSAAHDVAYLELDELVIPLSPRTASRHLVFKAFIEAAPSDIDALERIRPRILDVFNTYLRAVDEREMIEPSSMAALRARLMRRLSVVTAPVEPMDLLITTFVLK